MEIVRDGYEAFRARGEFVEDFVAPDFVWDMSTFRGWLESPTYAGLERANEFLGDWIGIWDDWEVVLEELHDAGDEVVLIACQRGRAEATGVPLEMRYGQVWRFRGEQLIRTETYSDPAEAMEAAGL